MQFENEARWQEYVSLNTDFYGKGIIDFAERWANLLEQEMVKKGIDTTAPMSKISLAAMGVIVYYADKCEEAADTDGISGFMYGAAVATLSDSWKFGKLLLRFHNREYESDGVSGDALTDQGKVINPAGMIVGDK